MELLSSKPMEFTNGGNHLHHHISPHSLSPGSVSARSSNSSLNNANAVNCKMSLCSAAKKDFRKVVINDSPEVMMDQQQPATNANAGRSSSSPQSSILTRTSLIHISSEKRAKKVRFFINSDKFFKGAIIAVSCEKFRTFDKLLEHLTKIMCSQVTLPNGVRFIFALDGKLVQSVDELLHGGNYVCSSVSNFRRLDYLKLSQDQDSWSHMKRDSCCLGVSITRNSNANSTMRRDAFHLSGHSKSFGLAQKNGDTASANANAADSPRVQIKPKIIAVLRSGIRPRKAVRVLLNNRNTKSMETVLADLTSTVKLDTGAVRKVFSLSGKPVVAVADFAEEEVFIAYGLDKCSNDDFDLDLVEFRSVQSILKSPELDAKYDKFSSCSPKVARKKFLLIRMPLLGSQKPQSQGPKQRKASKSRQCANGGSTDTILDADSACSASTESSSISAPPAVTAKYSIGPVIGDGNFAVVYRCTSRRTKQDFALKVIDKSKCSGKEHMIESEIAILNLVSHPHIIELLEVFDFADEKYLVTEYVKGGDLFDAIAVDTKYSEHVSRRMICDMTSALKYLHDKMIVHRDIKPENLLVVDLSPPGNDFGGGERLKSLKLGDFGLAQLVSEPLFTVCGTPTYVAPEILAETGYGVKVDVWATGVIMYILLVGYPPFSSRTNNQEELFDQILSGLFEFNSPDWDDISYPAKELISWMLQVDPLQRYSAYEILQHPWVKETPVSPTF